MNRPTLLLVMGIASVTLDARADGYVGTYTERAGSATGSAGIYHFQWDARGGELRGVETAASAVNPSFLVMHPRGDTLYAANETTARVSAYAVHAGGALELLGNVSAAGKGPCHLAVDTGGQWLFVANYGTGNLVVLPIAADGSLGDARQAVQHTDETSRPAHAHQTVVSPDGRFVLSVDLGLDKVFVYRWDRVTGALTTNGSAYFEAPAGSGPRHLVFSKDGTEVYLLTELSAELLTLSWDAGRGRLQRRATARVLPPDYGGEKSGAELALHPNGRWLYVSSRGTANDIAVFALGRDGIPRLIGHQPATAVTPRFIGIAPLGQYLLAAGQGSNDISIFRIRASGLLEAHGQISLPTPVDILWH
jgi:6-phosphogluconolactonase